MMIQDKIFFFAQVKNPDQIPVYRLMSGSDIHVNKEILRIYPRTSHEGFVKIVQVIIKI